MCLGVFLASADEIVLFDSTDLSVQEVGESEKSVGRLFSLPHVRYVGAHTGCSCGFPHVAGDSPVEWYEGFFDEDADTEDRLKDLASVRSLFSLIAVQLEKSALVEIFPAWEGDEREPPLGTIDLAFHDLAPERFFFNERYLHRIRA